MKGVTEYDRGEPPKRSKEATHTIEVGHFVRDTHYNSTATDYELKQDKHITPIVVPHNPKFMVGN